MALPVQTQKSETGAQQEQQSSGGDAGTRMRPPMARLADLWDELPSLLFDGGLFDVGSRAFTPPADIEETDDAYVVEVELPGVRKEDVDISVSGRRLIVNGERKEKERTGVLRRRTRTVGRFYYEVVLPQPVDDGAVSASLSDGVLTIRVSKQDTERARKIKVD